MNAFKYISIAAGIVFCAVTGSFAQTGKTKQPAQKTTPEIAWQKDRKLIWEDFRAKAGAKETKYALTTSGISVGTQCAGGKFNYQVKAVFVPHESWTRDRNSADLLAHEQAHFDITELHARKLRLIFSQLPDGCVLTSEQISELVDPIYAASDKMQEEYDRATQHGINKQVQRQWQQLIEESLKSLDQVALP